MPSFFNTLLEEEKRESESKKKNKKEEKETKDKDRDRVDEKETTEKTTKPNEDLDPHLVYAKEMLYEDWDYAKKHQDKERADYKEQQDFDLEEEDEEEDDEYDEEDDEEEETPYFSIKINQPTDLIPAHLQPIDSLQKLMCLGHLYRKKSFYRKNYSINVKGLYDMIPALQDTK